MEVRFVIALALLVHCIPETGAGAIYIVQGGESIQHAIGLAANGDTLILEDGLYEESVQIIGSHFVLGSRYLLDGDSMHIAETRVIAVSAGDTSSCFAFLEGGGGNSQLIGVTLQGTFGTAARSQQNTLLGGGVYLSQSLLQIEKCKFISCHSVWGGGIGVSGIGPLLETVLLVNNCEFIGCTSESQGGAIFATICSLSVDNSRFEHDTSLVFGGAICAYQLRANLINSAVLECVAESGGGVFINDVTGGIEYCSFIGNESTVASAAAHINSINIDGFIQGNIIESNRGSSLSCLIGGNFETRIIGNIIRDNSATDFAGTLELSGTRGGEVAYNVFDGNASTGAAIQSNALSPPRIHHNSFRGNRSLDASRSSVLRTVLSGPVAMDSNIIAGNWGNTISYFPNYPIRTDARNNWWGSVTGPYSPTRNPSGQGDTLLSDSALFEPWLLAPPDTTTDVGNENGNSQTVSTWEVLSVYPNPFNSSLTISLAGFARTDFNMILVDLLGRQVATIHHGALIGSSLHYSAPAQMSSGIYFLVASDDAAVRVSKVVFLK